MTRKKKKLIKISDIIYITLTIITIILAIFLINNITTEEDITIKYDVDSSKLNIKDYLQDIIDEDGISTDNQREESRD